MNPIAARAVEEPEKVNRNVFCKLYEDCLDVALSRGWKSFSCGSCADFSPLQKAPLSWQEDMMCCGALVGVVFGLRIMPQAGF
ncbi:MAG: hypothetical protein ACLQBD_25655 [Syntrophobacteraceae bacterium]